MKVFAMAVARSLHQIKDECVWLKGVLVDLIRVRNKFIFSILDFWGDKVQLDFTRPGKTSGNEAQIIH